MLPAEPTPEKLPGGCVYREMTIPNGPFVVQILEIPRKSRSIELGVTLGDGSVLGIVTIDGIVKNAAANGRRVLAAMNGDFFILQSDPFQGDPIGLCVENGDLVSSPIGRSALVFSRTGSPSIGRFSLDATVRRPDGSSFPVSGINQPCPDNAIVLMTPSFADSTRPQNDAVAVTAGPATRIKPGATLKLTVRDKGPAVSALPIPDESVVFVGRGKGGEFIDSFRTGDAIVCPVALHPSGGGSILHAVGGGPRLLRKGRISIEAKEEGIGESFVTDRHPRTAFGYNGKSLFLVTVDGRQPGYSVGMSLTELADLMKKLGATEAVNLDGGGSTTLWVNGSVRNRPSGGSLRPIANAIMVYVKE